MNNKGKTSVKFLGMTVIAMFFFSFALVPLYNVFCEVTGINGKVFQSENSQEFMAEEGEMSRFNLSHQIMKECLGFFNPLMRLWEL